MRAVFRVAPGSGLAGYTIGRVRTPSAVILAVAISAGCWIVFAALAIVVSTSDTLSVDQSVLTWLGEHRGSGVTSAMRTVTWLGSAAVLYPATLMLALFWWRRDRDWRAGAMLAASLAGSTALYNIFKRIIERPRPRHRMRSGHIRTRRSRPVTPRSAWPSLPCSSSSAASRGGLGCSCGQSPPLPWCSWWAPRGSTSVRTGSPTCWEATRWAEHGSRCSPRSA